MNGNARAVPYQAIREADEPAAGGACSGVCPVLTHDPGGVQWRSSRP